jgi:hypothetical protein
VPPPPPQSSFRPTWKDTALSGLPSPFRREEQRGQEQSHIAELEQLVGRQTLELEIVFRRQGRAPGRPGGLPWPLGRPGGLPPHGVTNSPAPVINKSLQAAPCDRGQLKMLPSRAGRITGFAQPKPSFPSRAPPRASAATPAGENTPSEERLQ